MNLNTFDGLKTGKSTFISSWGKEHYIALANKNGNNYDGDDGMNNFTIPSSKTEQESKTQSGTEFTKQAKGLTS